MRCLRDGCLRGLKNWANIIINRRTWRRTRRGAHFVTFCHGLGGMGDGVATVINGTCSGATPPKRCGEARARARAVDDGAMYAPSDSQKNVAKSPGVDVPQTTTTNAERRRGGRTVFVDPNTQKTVPLFAYLPTTHYIAATVPLSDPFRPWPAPRIRPCTYDVKHDSTRTRCDDVSYYSSYVYLRFFCYPGDDGNVYE